MNQDTRGGSIDPHPIWIDPVGFLFGSPINALLAESTLSLSHILRAGPPMTHHMIWRSNEATRRSPRPEEAALTTLGPIHSFTFIHSCHHPYPWARPILLPGLEPDAWANTLTTCNDQVGFQGNAFDRFSDA
jgi:hypothetical protein